jgi:hypothetical protein
VNEEALAPLGAVMSIKKNIATIIIVAAVVDHLYHNHHHIYVQYL